MSNPFYLKKYRLLAESPYAAMWSMFIPLRFSALISAPNSSNTLMDLRQPLKLAKWSALNFSLSDLLLIQALRMSSSSCYLSLAYSMSSLIWSCFILSAAWCNKENPRSSLIYVIFMLFNCSRDRYNWVLLACSIFYAMLSHTIAMTLNVVSTLPVAILIPDTPACNF